jgi:prepilin-type N-terminal cleavage/methylation domain-containing protein
MEETGHTGFTLIELLLTVALVALLAGLAVPAMSRFLDNGRLRGAAEQLVQDLRQARNRALTFQQDVYVAFAGRSGDRWCYGWRERQACDCRLKPPADKACAVGTAGAALQRRLSSDFPRVTLHTPGSDAVHLMRFTGVRGTADADTLRLDNPAGEVRVIVSPLGRVRACSAKGRSFSPC